MPPAMQQHSLQPQSCSYRYQPSLVIIEYILSLLPSLPKHFLALFCFLSFGKAAVALWHHELTPAEAAHKLRLSL